MKIKFIHTSDIHLGMKFQNKKFSLKEREKQREELWDTFENIISTAKQENINYLFIAGDMTEGDYLNFKSLKRIVRNFKKIENTKIIIACGSSDYLNINNIYEYMEWPENVYFVKYTDAVQKLYFDEHNLCVYSLSWDKQSSNEQSQLIYDISVDENKINVLLLCCDTENLNSKGLPINADLIKNKFDYCALGGKHNFSEIKSNVLYSGTPEPLDFEETKEHGIIKGELEKNNLFLKFSPIAKRKFIKRTIELDISYGYNKILDLIKFSGDTFSNIKDYVKVNLTGFVNTDVSMDEVEREAKQFFYYIEFEENYIYKNAEEKHYDSKEFNIIESYKLQFDNHKDKLEQQALELGLKVLRKEKVVK